MANIKILLKQYMANTKRVDLRQSISNPIAVDSGNREIQGRPVTKTLQFALFTENKNAVWAAFQTLRKESYPFATVQFCANREVFRLEVGDCFRLSYTPYNISNMICRVARIEEEELSSERIIVYAMEDIYSVNNVIEEFVEPADNTQLPSSFAAQPITHSNIFEVPYAMSSDFDLLPIACRESEMDLGFIVSMSYDGDSYFSIDSVSNFLPYGTLVGTYPADTFAIDEDMGFTVDFVRDVEQVETTTWQETLAASKNVALLGNEIISFQSITPVSGTQYKIENVIRGRFGTTKQEHQEGTDFYCIHPDVELVTHSGIIPGASLKFKLVPYTPEEAGDIADAIALDLTIEGKALTPYTPANLAANGSSFAARYDSDIAISWSPRYRGKGAGIGIPGKVVADAERDGVFRIEVWVENSRVRNTENIDATSWTYTATMNQSDNGTLANSVTFKVFNYRTENGMIYESEPAEVTCKKN